MALIRNYRRDVLKVSQQELARRLGLSSKSHMWEIENTDRCAPHVALKIEELSEGAIDAAAICPAVAIVRQAA